MRQGKDRAEALLKAVRNEVQFESRDLDYQAGYRQAAHTISRWLEQDLSAIKAEGAREAVGRLRRTLYASLEAHASADRILSDFDEEAAR